LLYFTAGGISVIHNADIKILDAGLILILIIMGTCLLSLKQGGLIIRCGVDNENSRFDYDFLLIIPKRMAHKD
jgi:hypothetical protein